MICPVEIARDMSAWRAVRIGDHAEHGSLSEGRDGAGDESTGLATGNRPAHAADKTRKALGGGQSANGYPASIAKPITSGVSAGVGS